MASKAKTIRVYSNSSSVSHRPYGTTFYWLWEQNPYEDECYLDLDRKEFEEEMRRSVGLRKMFEKGILSIKDSAILEAFKLDNIDEYIMNNKQLEDFIESSTVSEFEEFLQFAPQAMIDNIEVVCTAKELTDRNKIKLFRKYTGKDLEEFYDDKADEGEKISKPEVKKGRQPRKPVIK
jgi:hypothetical protein